MAAGEIVGSTPCRCGGLMTYREGKAGGISGACDSCKRQTFDRTPKAVEAIRAKLARATPKDSSSSSASSTPAKKSTGLLGDNFLEKL